MQSSSAPRGCQSPDNILYLIDVAIQVHERPFVLVVPGLGGFRFSDTVLVTETGNIALTRAPESAAELTLPVH
jgi:Xaa-Pro aminopeptidase